MSDRQTQRTAFLAEAGWGAADVEALAGDASTRSYFRIYKGEDTAILMDAPAGAEAPACPVDASEQERQALGYNAVARLAGPNLAAFVTLSDALTQRGFSAPKILHAAFDSGLLLIEDLGDQLYARLLQRGYHEGSLYAEAVDVLAAIYRSSFSSVLEGQGAHWPLQAYDSIALRAETELFLDWFLERYAESPVSRDARSAWAAIWAREFKRLDSVPHGLVLRDFHAENLLLLEDRTGQARIGLIDYQDALIGHPAYDLVSLLEDARRNVDRKLASPLKARFIEKAGIADAAGFDASYAVLGAQRNAKILGIFVRLALRDGKARYLDMLPHVARLFVGDLQHPALLDLLNWTKTHAPSVFREAHK